MQFSAAPAPKAPHKTDAFILFRGQDVKRVSFLDKSLAAAANAAIKAKEFAGKSGQTVLLHGGRNGRRLLLAGLGENDDAESYRKASAAAARALERHAVTRATILVRDAKQAAAATEGAGLAAYRFTKLKSKPEKPSLRQAQVAPESGKGTFSKAVKQASALVEAVGYARDLGNLPGNMAHAVYLAKQARTLSGKNITVKIHNRADIKRPGFPGHYP